MDWFQVLRWVLGPWNQINTVCILKELKVHCWGGAREEVSKEDLQQDANWACENWAQDVYNRRTDSCCRGRTTYGIPRGGDSAECLVGTHTCHAEEQEKEFQGMAVSMQRLAEAGKFREMQSHGWRVVCGWCRARDGTGTGSRGDIWSSDFEGPRKATVVVKQGLTSQAFGLEAALWLLHGGRIRGA